MKKLSNLFGLTIFSLLPTLTFAADPYFNFKLTEKPASGSLESYIVSVTNWVVGLAGALAMLFIIYGGILLVTSAGNTKRVDTAKKTLTYAIIGLVAVILARVVLSVITGSFGSILGSGSARI